ncbi:DNA-directed RNA polymerase subunit L [Pyrodictium occultum]|uniref:DNA-directed RNA polymerase subunit Rpo11 n=1 Tax=Pyrodictium occultum TaxID=2309 RepID=A0A0V8RUP6_PYROC|nr:DNA-directed RNA polymerase subunit L [Pyrodictium occultum]KSW11725.1 DNA-directed RNA polymerase subunit L [Pyrodictium occultum]
MAEKVKLLKREGNSVELELVGEDHTMANLIAKYAIRKPGVVYSSYMIPHPLIGNPVIVLSTDGSRDPLDVVEEVLSDIIRDAREFRRAFEEALKSNAKCEA